MKLVKVRGLNFTYLGKFFPMFKPFATCERNINLESLLVRGSVKLSLRRSPLVGVLKIFHTLQTILKNLLFEY